MLSHVARAGFIAFTLAACAAAPQAASPGATSTQAPTTPSSTPTAAPATPAASATATPTTTASAVVVDPATVDPCTIIDAAQIGAVLGETVTAGVFSETEERASCFYDVAAWPVPIMIPEDSGVSLSVFREPKSATNYEPVPTFDQQVLVEVQELGDAA